MLSNGKKTIADERTVNRYQQHYSKGFVIGLNNTCEGGERSEYLDDFSLTFHVDKSICRRMTLKSSTSKSYYADI
jgi:hypothetical protein